MATLPNDFDAYAPASTSGAATAAAVEPEAYSGLGVNSVLARRRAPAGDRRKLVLVAGISMLALVGIAAGALAVLSHNDKTAAASTAPPAAVTVQAAPLPATAVTVPNAIPEPASVTPAVPVTDTAPAAPAPRVHHVVRRVAAPATAPTIDQAVSDEAPPAVHTPAPITTVPPPVQTQPEVAPPVQTVPIVPQPPVQPVQPQSTPQPVEPSTTPHG